jgi:hypothetical protein
MSDALAEAVTTLYRLPPEEFVSARDERVKALRAAGDAPAAKQVAALRKPTVGAWLVNLLVADDPSLSGTLAELAAQLRTAADELAGPDLRALGRQRQELVAGLVHRARQLAYSAGRKTTESVHTAEVESTLRAALADPDVARDVLSGRLLHAAEFSGFGVAGSEPTAAPTASRDRGAPKRTTGRAAGKRAEPAEKESGADRRRREARERAEQRVQEAEQAVREAEAGRAAADKDAAEAADALRRADEAADELRGRLQQAEALRERCADQSDRARRAVREAAATVRVAEAALRRARNRVTD